MYKWKQLLRSLIKNVDFEENIAKFEYFGKNPNFWKFILRNIMVHIA